MTIDPVNLTADLIRCESVTPKEAGALVLLEELLAKAGFECNRVDRGLGDGVTGPEMMIELKDQAQRFETDVRPGFIDKVDVSGDVHKCWSDDGKEIHADTGIISTGASAKYLGLESEQK